MKNAFVLYRDNAVMFFTGSEDMAGKLIRAVFNYQNMEDVGELPEPAKSLFQVLQAQFKRDNEKYNGICMARSEAGKRGGRPKKANAFDEKQKKQMLLKKAKKADSDNDSDNDNDIFLNGESPLPKSFKNWSNDEFQRTIETAVESNPEFMTIQNDFFDYWTEPDPKGKPKFSKEPTWDTKGRLKRWLENKSSRQPAPNITAEDKIQQMTRERKGNF